MNRILNILFLLIASNSFAQQDGYWDKDRATTKEIIVKAGERVTVKTEDFPTGTTEVVYRITLLDENQQMANSLVSLLKSIPDPSGISQGSAGAVFLLSKVSGDDKCNYGIFANENAAKEYKVQGKTEKACLFQNTPVNKDAKRLSIGKSSCLNVNSENMWFGFESKNWIMKQKIILEVVPWVDTKLNRGWNLENRKQIIALVKTSDLVKRMINQDDFSLCVLEKMQKQYSFPEYQKLMAIEKTKAYKDFGNACLTEKPANTTILDNIRADAATYFKKAKYTEAIDLLLLGVVNNGNATAFDYNALGMYYIYSKQYEKAIKVLKDGQKIDSSELLIKLNMAHAYLLNNDYASAKEIHKKYKSQNVTADQSWISKTKSDFESFSKSGIQNEDFGRILKLLD